MATTISAILPVLQDAAAVVGREQTGFIAACYKNTSVARAGLNQTVNYPIVPTMSSSAVTPAATSSDGATLTVGAGSISMANLKKVSWSFTGEQEAALSNGDIGVYRTIFGDTLSQAMRTLANEIESALWVAAYINASRAVGTTAGTAPFATAANLTELAGLKRILDDNGAPPGDRAFVAGSDAIVNLLGLQTTLTRVSESGSDAALRQGSLGKIFGFDVYNSTPITSVTAGTHASATTNSSGYAVGAQTLTGASAGTGTMITGDIVTFAGDTNKYVLQSPTSTVTSTTIDADVSGGWIAYLGRPGLRVAMSAATKALTGIASSTRHIGFQKNGLHLVMRAPNDGNDGASDVATVTDPKSGLVFQLARYGQYMQSSWELRCLYGVAAPNSDCIAVLYG